MSRPNLLESMLNRPGNPGTGLHVMIPTLAKVRPAKDSDMKTLTLCLALSCLLTGCVSQRYVGVQITSKEPMSITRVMVNGDAVVKCRVNEQKNARKE